MLFTKVELACINCQKESWWPATRQVLSLLIRCICVQYRKIQAAKKLEPLCFVTSNLKLLYFNICARNMAVCSGNIRMTTEESCRHSKIFYSIEIDRIHNIRIPRLLISQLMLPFLIFSELELIPRLENSPNFLRVWCLVFKASPLVFILFWDELVFTEFSKKKNMNLGT